MTTGNSVFQLRTGAGWLRGLENLLEAELGRWFRTKKWWVQMLVWAGLVNGILVLMVAGEEGADSGELAMAFTVLLSVFATIGVCILMQGSIVGEKQSGTAAWILSKPVSRSAFVLAKLVANTAGIAVTIVLAQGLIAYLIILAATGTALPPLGFLGCLGVELVHMLFYITLTLMLGAAFRRRGPVIAIPLVFLFAQQLVLSAFPALARVLPWTLTVPLDESEFLSVAMALMTGSEPLSYLPLATTLAGSAVFMAIALLVFSRLEF
jgi:ABC-2 type transport system permease protein